MLYTYNELLKIKEYNHNMKIQSAINCGQLFKLDKGLYSDKKLVADLEIVAKKYNTAIFNSDSAYFYHGLTDNIPTHYHLATKKNARKVDNKKIIQTFMSDDYYLIGKSKIIYNNIEIDIYDKERMLIELIRNKNKIASDMYREIINNYRNQIDGIDLIKLQNYISKFKNGSKILYIIQQAVLRALIY